MRVSISAENNTDRKILSGSLDGGVGVEYNGGGLVEIDEIF